MVICERQNEMSREHAKFLHIAIREVLAEAEIKASNLDAVAVTTGPGSYTGIRVGFAAAKGLCFALSLPLIAVNTLEFLAACGINAIGKDGFYVPMIDARRMEVYTAIYDRKLEVKLEPQAMILNEQSFLNYKTEKMYFFGNGSEKLRQNTVSEVAHFYFEKVNFHGTPFASLTFEKFNSVNFVNIAYSEPQYLKEFFSVAAK